MTAMKPNDQKWRVEHRILAFSLERIQRGQQLIEHGERML
jgi:hypothetical protein